MPKPTVTTEQAREIFREAFGQGAVSYSTHFKRRMAKRGVDTNDLLELSHLGLIFDPPEEDIKTGELKYSMECAKLELKVVFSIHQSGDKPIIRLITAIDLNR